MEHRRWLTGALAASTALHATNFNTKLSPNVKRFRHVPPGHLSFLGGEEGETADNYKPARVHVSKQLHSVDVESIISTSGTPISMTLDL